MRDKTVNKRELVLRAVVAGERLQVSDRVEVRRAGGETYWGRIVWIDRGDPGMSETAYAVKMPSGKTDHPVIADEIIDVDLCGQSIVQVRTPYGWRTIGAHDDMADAIESAEWLAKRNQLLSRVCLSEPRVMAEYGLPTDEPDQHPALGYGTPHRDSPVADKLDGGTYECQT